MNKNEPSMEKTTGLVCRAVRAWEGAFGGGAELSRVTERHLEVCDECQAFFAEDLSFEDMMRGEALTEKRAGVAMLPVNFEQNILRAVRESQPEVEQASRREKSWSLGLSVAGAAAGVALAVVISQNTGMQPTGPEFAGGRETERSGVAAHGEDVSEVASSAMSWWGALDARSSTLELAAKNPLQQEIDSVSSDAKAVVDFLALNFLPAAKTGVLEKPRGEAGQG